MSPRVSLIVPCHNLGRTLEDAVDSVFAQTLQDSEILIVNDGSTDPATRDLLRRYDWPRTRVLTLPRQHPAGALAAGLEAAQGSFVGILDPRQALEPAYLEQAVAALEAEPDLALVTCWLKTAGDPVRVVETPGLVLPDLLAACTVGPAALARRDVLVAAGGFDQGLDSGPDAEWDLWIRLAERGARGRVLPAPLVRLGAEGGVEGVSVPAERAARRLIDKHRDSYARHALEVLVGMEGRRRELAVRSAEDSSRLERRGTPAPSPGITAWPDAEERDRMEQLESALAEARHDLKSLRTSASWRVTAPLRAVHAWLARLGILSREI